MQLGLPVGLPHPLGEYPQHDDRCHRHRQPEADRRSGSRINKSFTINDQADLDLATPFTMFVGLVDQAVPAGAVANLRLAPNNVDVLVDNHGLFEGGTFSGGPRPNIVAGTSATFETTRAETDFQVGLPYVRGSGTSTLTFTSSRP